MKKLLIVLIFAVTFTAFSQETLKFYTYDSGICKKNRIFYTDTTCFYIIVKEKLHKDYFRMILYKNECYFDCIYSSKFVYIKKLQ